MNEFLSLEFISRQPGVSCRPDHPARTAAQDGTRLAQTGTKFAEYRVSDGSDQSVIDSASQYETLISC